MLYKFAMGVGLRWCKLGLGVDLLPYLLGLLAILPRLTDVVGGTFDALDGHVHVANVRTMLRSPGQKGGRWTYLLSQTHVEVVLDAVAAAGDLVPHTFGVTLVERLNQVGAVCSRQCHGSVRSSDPMHKLG